MPPVTYDDDAKISVKKENSLDKVSASLPVQHGIFRDVHRKLCSV